MGTKCPSLMSEREANPPQVEQVLPSEPIGGNGSDHFRRGMSTIDRGGNTAAQQLANQGGPRGALEGLIRQHCHSKVVPSLWLRPFSLFSSINSWYFSLWITRKKKNWVSKCNTHNGPIPLVSLASALFNSARHYQQRELEVSSTVQGGLSAPLASLGHAVASPKD